MDDYQDLINGLGLLIRKVRKKAGLSQSMLAEAAGVSRSSVTRIEEGQGGVSLAHLLLVLRVLNIKIQFIPPMLFEEEQ